MVFEDLAFLAGECHDKAICRVAVRSLFSLDRVAVMNMETAKQ
jgi:hypothetical protein